MIIKKLNLKDYFGNLEGENPVLEAYLPDEVMNRKDFKRPSMLICPGGGYGGCSPREAEPIALNFLPEGFNVFVLKYTCAPARFPTQICEVAAAMELIFQNAQEWRCDTQKISIMGFSAGGHLAAHYSTSFDCVEVREKFPESKAPASSVLCYPVISAKEGKCHKGSFQNLLGHHPLSNEEMKRFSLENAVKENTPPAFIWHTASDTVVPVYSSLMYANSLSEYNIPFELRIFPEGQHGVATCDAQTLDDYKPCYPYDRVWIKEAIDWLKYMNLA
ncbi:MAG: alpha/beta hydrolase [Ruminococcaceae bacterium]|nr:alpha/beta hydrolase [Oscillospiraceae bacterium]